MHDLMTDAEDVDILPDVDVEIEPTSEQDLEIESEAAPAVEQLASTGLVELLPADFQLSPLVKFIPNPALRVEANDAATYALSLIVSGADGLQRADIALTALRHSLRRIEEHLEEPIGIAFGLHRRLTTVRAEWQEQGKAAVETVGRRVYTEQKRLEAIALEQRRKAQAEADQKARELARQEAAAAARAKAPAPIVEEMQRQAETATAPPVHTTEAPPAMRGSSTVERWKARFMGTPAEDDPNPEMAKLSVPQRTRVLELMRAVLDGKAPLIFFDVNWAELNRWAAAQKTTFLVPGVEAVDIGGVRAKGSRGK